MLDKDDIYIARSEKQIARFSPIKPSKEGIAVKLFGILPKETDLDKAREERLSKN